MATDKIDTAFGERVVARRVGDFVKTLPRPSAPHGEWWFLNEELKYVPIHSNSFRLQLVLAQKGLSYV